MGFLNARSFYIFETVVCFILFYNTVWFYIFECEIRRSRKSVNLHLGRFFKITQVTGWTGQFLWVINCYTNLLSPIYFPNEGRADIFLHRWRRRICQNVLAFNVWLPLRFPLHIASSAFILKSFYINGYGHKSGEVEMTYLFFLSDLNIHMRFWNVVVIRLNKITVFCYNWCLQRKKSSTQKNCKYVGVGTAVFLLI